MEKDIKDLREKIQSDSDHEDFADQLYVSHQTVQPVPTVNFRLYLQFCQENSVELPRELQQALELLAYNDETKQSEEYKELERLLSKN